MGLLGASGESDSLTSETHSGGAASADADQERGLRDQDVSGKLPTTISGYLDFTREGVRHPFPIRSDHLEASRGAPSCPRGRPDHRDRGLPWPRASRKGLKEPRELSSTYRQRVWIDLSGYVDVSAEGVDRPSGQRERSGKVVDRRPRERGRPMGAPRPCLANSRCHDKRRGSTFPETSRYPEVLWIDLRGCTWVTGERPVRSTARSHPAS